MKISLLVLFISFVTLPVLGQDNDIYKNAIFILHQDFRINGLLFNTSKQSIIKEFGNPQRIFEPKAECGFFSEDTQGEKFYTLKFDHFQFTGNETDKYELEKFNFTNDKIKITYKGQLLSSKTTMKDFEEMFEFKLNSDQVGLWYKDEDCQLIFDFKDGKLSKMHFWSPC